MTMRKALLVVVSCVSLLTLTAGQAIQVHPDNHHYYLFRGRPTLLITSAEHYGAVINLTFDYVAYLDALRAHGLNYTRIYPGAMFETPDKWITGNPIGPKPNDLILPWARSQTPGYIMGGNKFDLDHWNPAYFARLKDFLTKASERGVVVEICFFNSQYSDTWPISPLYYENNIQGIGKCKWDDAQALGCDELPSRQEDYVRKITREVNGFDNVILEICDECAGIGTGVKRAAPWVSRMMQAAYDTDRSLPQKHLIGQETEGVYGGPMDFSADPRLSVIVMQYVWDSTAEDRDSDPGAMRGLDLKYALNKPLELNETAWYPLWYKGDKIADARVEGWEFMVGGGGSLNELNGLYTPANPTGKSPDNDKLQGALQNLRAFLESFDFIKMRQDHDFLVGGLHATNVYYRVLSEPGRQYALYIHHSSERGTFYTTAPGTYQENLVVLLPPGNYKAEWIDPASGTVVASSDIAHEGGVRILPTPTYTIDIALRLKRTK